MALHELIKLRFFICLTAGMAFLSFYFVQRKTLFSFSLIINCVITFRLLFCVLSDGYRNLELSAIKDKKLFIFCAMDFGWNLGIAGILEVIEVKEEIIKTSFYP